MKNDILNKFNGCLIGGAVGDALGYAIEFYDIEKIKSKYGKDGIIEYDKYLGQALISDDTQMTMFTAVGILSGVISNTDNINNFVYYSYLNWLKTQGYKNECIDISWLSISRKLYFKRAPGNTCLSALISKQMGTVDNPINNSKGCGGVMRVAPVGLYFSNKENFKYESAKLGCDTAAITHGHEMGYLSAALLAVIVANILNSNNNLKEIVIDSNNYLFELYKEKYEPLFNMINNAIKLSENNLDDVTNIESIGGGWVGDEAIAIAVYCCVKYPHDFKKVIVTAVNHSGDSDSTGAIAGNIIGCFLGYNKIPKNYIKGLELLDEIKELSKDLYDCTYNYDNFIKNENNKNKYVKI